MENLLWFAVWAGLIFFMMRFGCGAHVMGRGHGQYPRHGNETPGAGEGMRWEAPASDIDPVCRMNVNTASAKSAVYRGMVYYFCSSECRDRFEAAPQKYVGPDAAREPKQMEHSHG